MFRVFTYGDLGELRSYVFNNKLWFVTADIVNLLGCEDTQKLSAEYVSYSDMGITAYAPESYIVSVNECGAYSLICGIRNVRSKKLLHWLVDEVIPELRKYITPIAPAVDVSAITTAPAAERADFSNLTRAIKLHYGEPKRYHFSNEYNMLNKLVLGMTATVSGETGTEQAIVGETVENVEVCFSVRYCEKISSIISTKYRIIFRNEIYDIMSVDHFSYTKKHLKFKCRKARR